MSNIELHLTADRVALVVAAVEEARDLCRKAANTARLPLSARQQARRHARQYDEILDFFPR